MTQSPWQIGVHQQSGEVGEPSEAYTPTVLRRSTRARKPNPKYANATIVAKIDSIKELELFEEALQNWEWTKAMEEEIVALERNQTWKLVPKPKDVKPILVSGSLR